MPVDADFATVCLMSTPTSVAGERADAPELAVTVREIDEISDLAAASALLDEVWGVRGHANVVPVGVLRAWTHTGNYVAGAFLRDQLVGVSAAFFGHDPAVPAARVLHSHITGVLALARGRRVGYALKLHQREWALERGIDRISWTFDPVVRRNARFNLVTLGASPQAYLVDFYGGLEDSVNAGQSSDRLWVAWDLLPAPGRRALMPAPGAHPLLSEVAGRPRLNPATDAAELLVCLPDDIEALRLGTPALAAEWRSAVRAALHDTTGYTVAGLTSDDCYLLKRDVVAD